MMKKIRIKVFWTRLSVAIVLLILISIFFFGTFERVAEAQMLPPPTITSISPNAAEQGQTLELFISGMHFADGATLSFSPPTGITATSVKFVNPMELKATIIIAKDALIGSRDITVTNPDGQSFTLPGEFIVFTIAPDTMPPEPVTGLIAADAHDGKVDLTWIPSEAEDFNYYAIYVSETEITNVTDLSPIATITDIIVHTYKVTGLEDGMRYYFCVTVVDKAGNEHRMVTSTSATPTKKPSEELGLSIIIIIIIIIIILVAGTFLIIVLLIKKKVAKKDEEKALEKKKAEEALEKPPKKDEKAPKKPRKTVWYYIKKALELWGIYQSTRKQKH